jgi:hypothetical protein
MADSKFYQQVRNVENLHITLWLIKDAAWVLLWKPLGLMMIIPTIAVAIYLAIKNWEDVKERLHNLAVCMWICANSTWMIGEFYFEDGLRPVAIVFFSIGILCIALWHWLKWYRAR